VRRVNELDFYSLGAKQLAEKLGLTVPKLVAVVDSYGIRKDAECYKEFKIGSQLHKRYSPRALDRIKTILEGESVDGIWERYRITRVNVQT